MHSNLNTKYKTDLMEDLKALTATEEHKAKLFFARRTLVSHELKEMSKDYPELDKLIPYLTGKRGLLFTTLKKSEAIEKLLAEKYSGLEQDPQAGDMAPKKVLIPAGIKDLPFSLEETLTRLGLPIKVEKVRKPIFFFSSFVCAKFSMFFFHRNKLNLRKILKFARLERH